MRAKFRSRVFTLFISAIGLIICGRGIAEEVKPSRSEKSAMSQNAFTAIEALHRKNTVKRIWASNKNFYAATDLEQGSTTVFRVNWQGNVGRSEEFWRLDRSFEIAWLSNDGQHLISGHFGEGRLPLNTNKDHVMLVFFSQGNLVREVALSELIVDCSALQKTGTGYSWGRYLGLNSAGYFVVQPIHAKYILFDPSTGKPTTFKGEGPMVLPNRQLFQDVMRCYEFQYPGTCTLTEHVSCHGTPTGWNSIRKENEDWVIDTSVENMAAHGSAWQDREQKSFRDFVLYRVKAMFCADGPHSSRYVNESVSEKSFSSSNDVPGLELYLREIHETYGEDGEDGRIEERTIGPVYAMSISQPGEAHRVLFFEINYNRPVSPQQKMLLKDMVDTVRILK